MGLDFRAERLASATTRQLVILTGLAAAPNVNLAVIDCTNASAITMDPQASGLQTNVGTNLNFIWVQDPNVVLDANGRPITTKTFPFTGTLNYGSLAAGTGNNFLYVDTYIVDTYSTGFLDAIPVKGPYCIVQQQSWLGGNFSYIGATMTLNVLSNARPDWRGYQDGYWLDIQTGNAIGAGLTATRNIGTISSGLHVLSGFIAPGAATNIIQVVQPNGGGGDVFQAAFPLVAIGAGFWVNQGLVRLFQGSAKINIVNLGGAVGTYNYSLTKVAA